MNATTDVTSSGDAPIPPGDTDAVMVLFNEIADAVAVLVEAATDWSWSGERAGQYAVDVSVDELCLDLLHGAGFAVLSEESGITNAIVGDDVGVTNGAIVVVDPLDGSTNASLGLPWCATSLCLVVDGSPTVALVANLRTGVRYEAVRGRGATSGGRRLRVAEPVDLADAIVAVNARPPDRFRPRQFRAMGATALDVAAVAGSGVGGGFDAYVDFDDDAIGVWDYLAAVLVVEEAGGVTADALGRDLVVIDHAARRRPMAATSPALLAQLAAVVSPT